MVRLRIVFGLIAIIFAVTTVIGLREMRGIGTAVDELTGTAVNVFVQAQEAERSLKSLLEVLQTVKAKTQLTTLSETRTALLNSLTDLRAEIDDLNVLETSTDLASRQSETLDAIDASAIEILRVQTRILRRRQTVRDIEAEILLSYATIRKILEDLSFETYAPPDFNVGAEQARDQIASIQEVFTQNLVRANTITGLTLQTESVIDTATGTQNLFDAMKVLSAQDELRFKTRNITLMIRQLDPSPERQELADAYRTMRDLIFGDQGMLVEIDIWQTRAAELSTLIEAQLGPIENLSALSTEITVRARQNIEDTRNDLTAASGRMIWVLTITDIATLLTIIPTVALLVERQINRRMAKLTKGVLTIAGGDTEHVVDVSGEDELGKMAKALDVFKSNANELKRSNAELEEFAYIAAHDLRSPLRAIQDLLDWTLEDPENQFSEDGRQNMVLLRRRAHRMNKLLSDLLVYSRAGQEGDSLAEVMPSDVVTELSDMLDPHKAFDISFVGPSARIVTHGTPLRQILMNLINNAIKHHDHKKGTIVVTARKTKTRMYFTVKDDGAGIDPKYHDKIFSLFRTLRPRDEVEGSGLGLAIIRKLVERYNGKIIVRSDPAHARGAEFTFDLPLQADITAPPQIAA